MTSKKSRRYMKRIKNQLEVVRTAYESLLSLVEEYRTEGIRTTEDFKWIDVALFERGMSPHIEVLNQQCLAALNKLYGTGEQPEWFAKRGPTMKLRGISIGKRGPFIIDFGRLSQRVSWIMHDINDANQTLRAAQKDSAVLIPQLPQDFTFPFQYMDECFESCFKALAEATKYMDLTEHLILREQDKKDGCL